jgi:hypothetical protein
MYHELRKRGTVVSETASSLPVTVIVPRADLRGAKPDFWRTGDYALCNRRAKRRKPAPTAGET